MQEESFWDEFLIELSRGPRKCQSAFCGPRSFLTEGGGRHSELSALAHTSDQSQSYSVCCAQGELQKWNLDWVIERYLKMSVCILWSQGILLGSEGYYNFYCIIRGLLCKSPSCQFGWHLTAGPTFWKKNSSWAPEIIFYYWEHSQQPYSLHCGLQWKSSSC